MGSREDDLCDADSCENHDFGEWASTDEYKTGKKWYLWDRHGRSAGWTRKDDRIPNDHTSVVTLSILRKHTRRCQNSGCEETDSRWNDYRVIPLDELETTGFNPSKFSEDYTPDLWGE